MVSEKKKKTVKEVTTQLGQYSVVGILDMHKLPARQLHQIRNKLRDQAVIKMVKKRLILMALEKAGLQSLSEYVKGEPALFLTKENPFRIARVLMNSKSEAPAKTGDIAPKDILIPEGPTNLPPGPAIGDLQKVKIPAGVEGDKIVVKKDTVVVKEGEEISEDVANILLKLEIQPMEIGLNLVAALEEGVLYGKDILFLPQEHYTEQLNQAVSQGLNLSVYINYPTKENMPILLSRAAAESRSLASVAGIINSDTIATVLAKGKAEAQELEKRLNK